MVVFCFLLFYWIGYVESGYVFVTAPNVLRYNHDEKVLLNVFEETNFDIEIWLQLTEGSEQFSGARKRVINEMTAVTTTIKVTEEQLFKDDESKKNPPEFVFLYAKTKYGTKKRKLLLDYNSGYIVLQTSKPVYHPWEAVQIRALAMTESLQYAKGWNLTVDIISPSDLTFGRITKTIDEKIFFEDSFQPPPHAELGLWTIRAFYGGQFNTEARTAFRIEEYVSPTFGVKVEVTEKIILEDIEDITIYVTANYFYKKPVKGTVGLTISCQGEDGSYFEYPETIYEKLIEGKATIVFNVSTLIREVGEFPDGKTLKVTARVTEQVTGNIESAVCTDTLFSRRKYQFDFTRSRKTFRPGLSYSLKVTVSLANGHSPGIIALNATELSGKLDESDKIGETDQNGDCEFIFFTSSNQRPLLFRVETTEEQSETFQVNPTTGRDQMTVDQFRMDDLLIMEAFTTIRGMEATRIMTMILSRGQYMHHYVLQSAVHINNPISNAVQEKISPEARLLGFYVDKASNRIVADSTKFSLAPKCEGKGLKLEATKGEPNSVGTLNVTGPAGMIVGLNVMDQALLHDNQRVFRKSQLVDVMKSHDLGCGEGGGVITEQVFRDAGMTILTNANVNDGALERSSLACEVHSRKKRAVKDQVVWEVRGDYVKALEAYRMTDEDVFVRSEFPDSWLFRTIVLDEDGKGEISPISLPHSLTTWMFQGIGIKESDGFCISEPVNVTSILPFFLQVDLPYTTKRLEYFEIKVTVFNYKRHDAKVTLFIEGLNGLCTGADPGKMKKVTKEFVLKKSDTYTVRIPVLALEAGRYEIEITAIGIMDSFLHVSNAVRKELLVGNEGVEKRETVTVCLNPLNKETFVDCTSSDRIVNSRVAEGVQTVTVDLTLPDGIYKHTGTAYARLSSNVMDDVVTTVVSGLDHLLNRPLGSGETIMIYLAPVVYVMDYWKQTKKMTSNRELTGNRWIREGLQRELAFRKNDGSYSIWLHRGSSTWLTAFVAKVFCKANKVTDSAVRTQHIYDAIDWLTEKTNSADGSFFDHQPVFHRDMIGQINEKDPSLTAFVLITLLECDVRTGKTDSTINRAVRYLTSLPDQKYMENTYLLATTTYALATIKHGRRWRYKNMLMNRAFEDKDKNFLYWGQQGQNSADRNAVETTAYALLALLKFNDIDDAGKIVRWLTNQGYAIGKWRSTQDTVVALQALSAYSYATKSPNVDIMVKLNANNWVGASMRLTNENSKVIGLIRDIPVGPGKNLITVNTDGEGSGKLVIDLRYNRPQNYDEECSFTVSGIQVKDVKSGYHQSPDIFDRECDVCGYCKNHHEARDEWELPFPAGDMEKRDADLSQQSIGKQFCISFDIVSKNYREHGMSIVDVGLETGMKVVTNNLDKLKYEGVIDNYEIPETGKGFVILYLKKITSEPTRLKFRLEETAEVGLETRQPVAIKIYDYYSPEYKCIKLYGTGDVAGSPVAYQCLEGDELGKGKCSCFSDMCPEATKVNKDSLVKEAKARENPAQKLSLYTCDSTKPVIAIIMKVEQIVPDFMTQAFTAVVTVVKQIHRGIEYLEKGWKIELVWRMNCQDIEMNPGEQYYLITREDQTTRSISGRLVFLLSAKSIIVEENEWAKKKMSKAAVRKLSIEKRKQRFLQRIMTNYEDLMMTGCIQVLSLFSLDQ